MPVRRVDLAQRTGYLVAPRDRGKIMGLWKAPDDARVAALAVPTVRGFSDVAVAQALRGAVPELSGWAYQDSGSGGAWAHRKGGDGPWLRVAGGPLLALIALRVGEYDALLTELIERTEKSGRADRECAGARVQRCGWRTYGALSRIDAVARLVGLLNAAETDDELPTLDLR